MGRPTLLRVARCAALAAVVAWFPAVAANTGVHDTPSALFSRAEAVKTADHPLFLRILKQLHQDESGLSPEQRWHLRYLDAWQDSFSGNHAKATTLLHDVVDHSNDTTLATRASALLIYVLSLGKHYEAAYTLANKLESKLPEIKNARAREEVLEQLIQMLSFAGQYKQASQYSRRLLAESRSGESRCKAESIRMNELFVAGRLSSTDGPLNQAIDLCLADKDAVFANTLRLDRADLLRTEGHEDRAIALLNRIGPSIRRSGYQSHLASLHITLAQAYLGQGATARAKKSALTVLAMNRHTGYTWPTETAYYVLYKVEEKAGHPASALAYYKKYVKLDEANMDDAKARALAYQMVKQGVTAKQLKLETLTKQNRILQLHQELEHKAAETSRLYIVLLLIAVLVIGFLLYRVKHSQLRFRRMARHDGLTGTFNRQHFFDEAERILRRLKKAGVDVCLILLDLDHFKRINDTYGHAAGDEVLQRAVTISRGELRTSDLLGRLGGEEFGILMPSCTRGNGVEIGERIRHALAAMPMKLDTEDTITVSASFGLACSDTSGYSITQLFTDADAALYAAKRSGRNQLIADAGEGKEIGGPDFDATPSSTR